MARARARASGGVRVGLGVVLGYRETFLSLYHPVKVSGFAIATVTGISVLKNMVLGTRIPRKKWSPQTNFIMESRSAYGILVLLTKYAKSK